MPRSTIGIARRGFVAFAACIVLSGGAVAQTGAPIPTPSANPPNAPAAPPAVPATPPTAPLLSRGQLEQLVAPIALYPDPLLAQILMASTYPLEVVEAARWVKAPGNQKLSGDGLTNALQAQNWDPSIKALVPFPRVLENMSDQLQWTEQLGNAFLAQQADVMAAVQSLRHQAMAAGNLKQTPQCRCVIQTSGEIISILPAEPQRVCVPVYSPAVYGAWPHPAYPPYSFPVPAGFAYEPGFWIGFGPPIVLASFGPLWGWGSVDWGRHDIVVDPGRYALASGGRVSFAGSAWVHDPAHRGGVSYADAGTRGRFDAARVSAVMAAHRDATAAARFGAAGSGAARGRAGRFGAAVPIHAGAAASRSEREFHSASAFHGGAGFRGGSGFHGAPVPHGRAAFHGGPAFHGGGRQGSGGRHGGGAPRVAMGGPHGGGGPHGDGARHFSMGAPHGSGAPHGGGPHGGGAGGRGGHRG